MQVPALKGSLAGIKSEMSKMILRSALRIFNIYWRWTERGRKGTLPVPTESGLRIKELTSKLLAGDRSVEDELILLNMPLAKRIARRFGRKHYNKQDDLYCTAMMALVQGVRWAGEGRLKDENIVLYLTITIQGKVRLFLEKDHNIAVPRKKFGQLIKVFKIEEFFPLVLSMDDSMDLDVNDGDTTIELSDVWAIATFDDDVAIYHDLCEALDMNQFEQSIVDLRIQNYTLDEIGQLLNVSRTWVQKTLSSLADRWRRIFGDEPKFKVAGESNDN